MVPFPSKKRANLAWSIVNCSMMALMDIPLMSMALILSLTASDFRMLPMFSAHPSLWLCSKKYSIMHVLPGMPSLVDRGLNVALMDDRQLQLMEGKRNLVFSF